MHLGHMVPFDFTKYLQDAFGAILIIQMSDDEKWYFKKEPNSLEHYNRLAYSNVKDIIARGFDLSKTYIFANSEEIKVNHELQSNVVKMLENTSGSEIKAIFGLDLTSSLGQMIWPIHQSVPAFSNSFTNIFGSKHIHCLIPMAIDQDPYFRLCRDFAHSYRSEGYLKPSVIHSEFLVALQGIGKKMSASEKAPAIFLTDSPEEIKEKVITHAFSGGGETKKLHQLNGANLTVDVAYQYLLYFLDDDLELSRIATEYGSGRMMTSEIKRIMIDCITKYVQDHQTRKAKITDEVITSYFDRNRQLNCLRPEREPIILFDDEIYDKLGINFDRYYSFYSK